MMHQNTRFDETILFSRWHAVLTTALLLAGHAATAGEPSAEHVKFFETHVRPILATRCIKCHGPDKQKGRLRLDSSETIQTGGESGAPIVPGAPDESLLLEAVRYESLKMPPDGKLKPDQIAALTRWVEVGAPWPRHDGNPVRLAESKLRFTDEDRAWWSFQPVQRPPVPESDDDNWSRGSIDRFIRRRLTSEGLNPAPPTDRRTLMRRATYDLTGLPPTPAEIDAFLADDAPDAYQRLVDRLLDSPRYGEHWGRYWLDLVRYADSDGYKQDAYRPEAYRYRDYVVQSLNEDKPYDQFVREQLAGDEIAPGDRNALVATMYLRQGIYEYNNRDVETQWHDILDDVTDVTGDVFLGLGMGCARCHDHKFDPILQKDYYRLQAFFTPLLPREDMPVADRSQRTKHFEQQRQWQQATASLRRELREIEQPLLLKHAGDQGFEKFPPEIKEMILRRPAERTPYEQQIALQASRQYTLDYKKLPERIPKADKQRWQALHEQLRSYDHLKPAALPTQKFVVSDVSATAPATFIPAQADERIEPGFLTVLDPAPAKIQLPDVAMQTTGRRTALARWITSPDNPLSTRVIANRIWQHHFGRGLVASASDFGRLGTPPSHPELLDYLTRELVDGGWRLKRIHRLIMMSATYRQDARAEPSRTALTIDPENRLLWRMNTRRLRAEEIRDSILAVSGELDLTSGGASVDRKSPRRAVYAKVMRNSLDPFLAAFDATDGIGSVSERNVTTTSTQALLVSNGSWMLDRAHALARRLAAMHPPDDQALVTAAYQLAFARPPAADEVAAAVAFLQMEPRPDEGEEKKPPEAANAPDTAPDTAPNRRDALVDFCHVLLCTNEFIYVD